MSKATNDTLIRKLLKEAWITFDSKGTLYMVRNFPGKVYTDIHGYKVLRYKNKSLKVHRIVYEAMVGRLKPHHHIDHIDGNKKNNHPDNLRQTTRSSNVKHMMKTRKKRNMTLTEAKKIRKLYKTGKYTQVKLAKKFRCSTRYIQHILARTRLVK